MHGAESTAPISCSDLVVIEPAHASGDALPRSSIGVQAPLRANDHLMKEADGQFERAYAFSFCDGVALNVASAVRVMTSGPKNHDSEPKTTMNIMLSSAYSADDANA